jgi:CHAT domain-containing protein
MAALKDERHIEAGPFRERLIGKLCRQGGELLPGPLLELLRASSVSRLLVSLPGFMSGLPLEAFSDAQHQTLLPGLEIAVVYLPSIRLGSDLLDHQRKTGGTGARPRSVLFIGYGGDDLDTNHAEYEGVAAACGGNLNYLPGSEATKQRVLEALRGEYDIIHIQAHGTFNASYPLNSALHFVPELEDDRRRITAFDLFNEVRFARAPVIVLSACSSAVTAGWRTGTYHGLLGSLLRVGAVGLIGSRWPVGDDGAVRFMTRLYRTLRDPGILPERALHAVVQELRAEGAPQEVWAAFGYFGMS